MLSSEHRHIRRYKEAKAPATKARGLAACRSLQQPAARSSAVGASSTQAAHSRLSMIKMTTRAEEKKVKPADAGVAGVNKGSSSSSTSSAAARTDVERQQQMPAEPLPTVRAAMEQQQKRPPSRWNAVKDRLCDVACFFIVCLVAAGIVGSFLYLLALIVFDIFTPKPAAVDPPTNEEQHEGLDNIKLLLQQLSAMQQQMQERSCICKA